MDRIKEKLSAVGDAIRGKTGKSDLLSLDEMPSEIAAIETGIKTDDATAVASDILNGKTAYVKGAKVTGTFSIDGELSTQDDLIAQIQAAVDGLPEAGGGNDAISYDTCTVEVSTNNIFSVIYSTIDENGKMTMAWSYGNDTHLLTVIRGSYIFVPVISMIPGYSINGDAEYIELLGAYNKSRILIFKINGISTISCYDND